MTIKHKVIKEYQFLSPDKKIFILKIGTILQEYVYHIKNESIPIDKQIIDNNPDFFELIDWKAELINYLKISKLPQPSQLGKKLIPFIEEMILSSIGQQNVPSFDLHKLKELEIKDMDLIGRERKVVDREDEIESLLKRKELDLSIRDKRIKDKEDEIEIRTKRVEKRESEYKSDLKNLDKKEDELRERSKELTERDLVLQDKTQDLNEKERNFDRSVLESSNNVDSKYIELQNKIDLDLKYVTEREKNLEIVSRSIKEREDQVNQRESNINDTIRDFELKYEEIKRSQEEITKLNKEIQDWEKMHWKFQRNVVPPSALPETMSDYLKEKFGK